MTISGVRGAKPSRGLAPRTAMEILFTVALGLSLTGCGGSSSPGAASAVAEPALGPVSTSIRQPADVSRPIDTYLLKADAIIHTEYARNTATNQCLSDKGYPGKQITLDPQMSAAVTGAVLDRTVRSQLYGYFEALDEVQQYGYKRPPWDPGGWGGTKPGDSVPSEVIDACEALGTKVAGSDDPMGYVLTHALPDGGPPEPAGDSRYAKAVQAWAGCMKDRGYRYSDPLAAIGDPAWQVPDDQRPSPVEVATATADVQCKISTNLIGVAVAVQAAYDQQYINAHSSQLADYTQHLKEIIQNTATTS